jgi:hypothetical protein
MHGFVVRNDTSDIKLFAAMGASRHGINKNQLLNLDGSAVHVLGLN